MAGSSLWLSPGFKLPEGPITALHTPVSFLHRPTLVLTRNTAEKSPRASGQGRKTEHPEVHQRVPFSLRKTQPQEEPHTHSAHDLPLLDFIRCGQPWFEIIQRKTPGANSLQVLNNVDGGILLGLSKFTV